MHKPWYMPVVNFGTHAVVGTLIFLIVGAPAVGLNILVELLETHLRIHGFVIYALKFLESAILGIDVVSVTYYIVVKSYKEIKDMTS
ncbi:hypothetical protein QN395_20105 [Undibacterium sp. RTI2.2]|uniref:hypothetical protein n=1 Tax=unclassified Undibacterium TaxID=2630295 RepID=UPI002B394A52|nr:hypothetical protein [Undibacterium sp. RTI2.2]